MTYQIHLPQFEGPFDLLLFFIQRDEISLYDIPIAKLADDFLHYLHQLEQMNIDVAGEFMLMAATLMQIKAKMLLPRRELDEQGEEIDPRQELVDKLLEYKAFKEVLATMSSLEDERQLKFKRGNLEQEITQIAAQYETEAELETISLFKLMQVFNKIMERYEKREVKVSVQMVRIPYTIGNQKEYLHNLFAQDNTKTIDFVKLFDDCLESRVKAIVRFLAMLEMIQESILTLVGGDELNNFWIKWTTNDPLITNN
ncbi:MAG: segregation/condensation protein A [Sphingobacteriales bacterium]|nr:segregation/condensation protein A [Sphingobacteriales bacterium]